MKIAKKPVSVVVRVCFIRFAILMSLSPLVWGGDGAKKSQTDSLFANASIADLRVQNTLPFHLRLEVHATDLSPRPLDGTYDEIWRSRSMWQRQISFPGFAQQEVGDSKGRWLSRNVDFRPHAVYLLSRAVETAMPIPLQPDEQIEKVFAHKKDGLEEQCTEFKRGNLERTLCFDSRGPLVRSDEHNGFDDRSLRIEYLDFQKFGEKLCP